VKSIGLVSTTSEIDHMHSSRVAVDFYQWTKMGMSFWFFVHYEYQ